MPEELLTNILIFKNMLWMEEYAFRMEKWFKGEKRGPMRIDAELHRRCNLNCRMCVRRSLPINLTEQSKSIEMSTKRWVEIVRESGKLGTKAWNIAGISEPMCKPKTLFEVMKTVKAYNMFGELTTNGTLWKEKDVKRTIEMGWDSVCVSIDAPDAKTHDHIRRADGAFKKATDTIRLFNKWRSRFNSEVPCLTLNMVLNKLNYKKLPDMIKLAHGLGADALFVEPMIVYTDVGEEIKLDEKEIAELSEIIKETKKLADEYYIAPTITCITPEKEFQKELIGKTSDIRGVLMDDARKHSTDKILSIPCYYPWFFLMIRADGSAIHCGECKKVGDNLKNKTLEEVWNGGLLNGIRKDFIEGGLPTYCKMCRPNVIEDMREMRRSIVRYRDRGYMEKKILDLLKENMDLKRELFRSKMNKGVSFNNFKKIKSLEQKEKELLRLRNSLSFKIGSMIGNTKIGKKIKKRFGFYV